MRSAAGRAARCCWSARSTSRPSCRSSAPATATGRSLAFPASRNVHDAGILVESVAPAPIHPLVAGDAREIADWLVRGLDLVGLLTVELFQLRGGGLMINELAPRVHNSGHWTIEGAVTSQFEQHLRAILGLPLGLGPAARVGGDGQPAGHGRGPRRRGSRASTGRSPTPTSTSTSTASDACSSGARWAT